MEQQTAMMQLLAQLKDERENMPLNIEWSRCYQAIEMVIKNTYISLEKEQHDKTAEDWWKEGAHYVETQGMAEWENFEEYWEERFKTK